MSNSQTKKKSVLKYSKNALRKPVQKKDKIVMPMAWLKGRRNPKPNWHLKLGDEVIVLSGKDKGKVGKITAVFPKEAKVTVEGINIQKRHNKQPGQEQGQIIEKSGKLWISKVAYCVEVDGKQVGSRIRYNDQKQRIAVKTGEVIS